MYALLPLRNAYVTGAFLTTRYADLLRVKSSEELIASFGRRMLYCFGIMVGGPDLAGNDISLATRWLLLTLLAMAAVVLLHVRRRFELADALCVAVLIAAYVPFAAVSKLGGYGMRFQLPYAPVLFFLVFRAGDLLWRPLRQRWAGDHNAAA